MGNFLKLFSQVQNVKSSLSIKVRVSLKNHGNPNTKPDFFPKMHILQIKRYLGVKFNTQGSLFKALDFSKNLFLAMESDSILYKTKIQYGSIKRYLIYNERPITYKLVHL